MAQQPVAKPIGEWAPDVAVINSPYLSTLINALPRQDGIEPIRGLNGSANTALAAACYGACVVRNSTGTTYLFAAANSKIYRSVPGGAWTDVTSTLGGISSYTIGGKAYPVWFAKFGTKLIAGSGAFTPIVVDIDTGTQFAALGGSPPSAHYGAAVGDFLFLVGIGLFGKVASDDQLTLWWSGINDITQWTPGTSLCDYQNFPDQGNLVGAVGDKSGYILQTDGFRTFQFLPNDTTTIFQFDKVPGVPGCAWYQGWTEHSNTIYYVSPEGFCSLGVNGFQRIGANKVDTSAKADVGSFFYNPRVSATLNRVAFGFTTSATGTTYAKTYYYDTTLQRWGYSDSGNTYESFVARLDGAAASTTVSPTDFITIDSAHKYAPMTGHWLSATATFAEMEPVPGQGYLITDMLPVGSSSLTSIADLSRSLQSSSQTTTTQTTQEANGRYSFTVSARYHQIKIVTAAATYVSGTPKYLNAVHVFGQPDGEA